MSCSESKFNFEGEWSNKKDKVLIKKGEDFFWVHYRGKTYTAKEKEGFLEINAELPVKAAIDDKTLIIQGVEYEKNIKSDVVNFIGKWEIVSSKNIEYLSQFDDKCTFEIGCDMNIKNCNIGSEDCDNFFKNFFNINEKNRNKPKYEIHENQEEKGVYFGNIRYEFRNSNIREMVISATDTELYSFVVGFEGIKGEFKARKID